VSTCSARWRRPHPRPSGGQSEQLLPHSRKPGPRVDTLRAAKVEIRCDRAQPVQFDGDTVEPTDRLDLEIDPSSLTLAVPEHPPGPDPPVRKNSDLIACSGGHSRGRSYVGSKLGLASRSR
jgi:hypothetical protein